MAAYFFLWARKCIHVRLTTDNTVRKRSKQEFFEVGSCIISQKWRICEEYMRTKTHRRKMYAAMECESVEISGLLQVRFELWSFENFPPQKQALIVKTLYLCTEEESYTIVYRARIRWTIAWFFNFERIQSICIYNELDVYICTYNVSIPFSQRILSVLPAFTTYAQR